MWQNEADRANRRLPAPLLIFVLVLIVAGLAAQPSAVTNDTTASSVTPDSIAVLCSLQDSFAVIAENARPGVVSITAVHRSAPGSRTSAGWITPRRSSLDDHRGGQTGVIAKVQAPETLPEYGPSVTASGSGAIVKRDGDNYYVLTNQHVVGNAAQVKVRLLDETELKAKVVGIDPTTDLAVVMISAPQLSHKNIIPMGDSDEVAVGAWAIALGSPLGFDETMTVGVVSALKRQLEDEETLYTDLIQTDAAINPGNSGGPLLDVEGKVIGINTAIASPTGGFIGLGFAIPINTAKSILDTLIENGRVIRGWLGVGIQDLTPALHEYYGSSKGVLVASVDSKGPGMRAGLQEEDVVVSINDTPIKDIFQMQSMITSTRPGGTMTLSVIRAHQRRELSAVVTQSPRTPSPILPDPVKRRETLGLRVRTLSDDLARRVGLEGTKGVIVVDIAAGGIAEEAGLEVGDVLTRMNGEVVDSEKQFAGLVEGVKIGGVIALKVVRDGGPRIVGLKRE